MKKSKLSIEKFRILEITNLSNVHGGTGQGSGPKVPENSLTTTYTTNPNEPCPSGDTGDTNNSYTTIPTLSF